MSYHVHHLVSGPQFKGSKRFSKAQEAFPKFHYTRSHDQVVLYKMASHMKRSSNNERPSLQYSLPLRAQYVLNQHISSSNAASYAFMRVLGGIIFILRQGTYQRSRLSGLWWRAPKNPKTLAVPTLIRTYWVTFYPACIILDLTKYDLTSGLQWHFSLPQRILYVSISGSLDHSLNLHTDYCIDVSTDNR